MPLTSRAMESYRSGSIIRSQPHREAPQWVVATVFALIGLLAFIGFSSRLGLETRDTLAAYQDIIQLGPRQANLTISLP